MTLVCITSTIGDRTKAVLLHHNELVNIVSCRQPSKFEDSRSFITTPGLSIDIRTPTNHTNEASRITAKVKMWAKTSGLI